MGIVREPIQPKVLEGDDGKIHLEELINVAMVVLSENSKEVGMNRLNNARNNMVDNFRSIKWIFYETKELKNRVSRLEGKEGDYGSDRISILETRVTEMDKILDRMECILHSSANQSLNIIKGLNDNIKKMQEMTEVGIDRKVDIVNKENKAPKVDANPLDGSPSYKEISNKRKRDTKDTLDENQLMTEVTETMEKLELKTAELVKDTMP